jgi:hypothetical protein
LVGGTNTIEQRNGLNGQKSRLFKTFTSATSGEWLELDAADNADTFDIATCVGSAGGAARGLRIGGKNAAGTFTPWLGFASAGAATFSGTLTATGLPTSDPSVTGQIWNDSGTLKISP